MLFCDDDDEGEASDKDGGSCNGLRTDGNGPDDGCLASAVMAVKENEDDNNNCDDEDDDEAVFLPFLHQQQQKNSGRTTKTIIANSIQPIMLIHK